MINPNLLINKKNWNQLINPWKNGKLPHALLFHGPEGSGKEGHALELTALLNCTTLSGDEPCGSCQSCKQTKSFQHGSVKLILPIPRGKIKSSDDPVTKAFSDSVLNEYLNMLKEKESDPYYSIRIPGANTILINSIREMKHDVSLSTVNDQWRVILIFQAEKLCIPSPEAAHALLKVLEEPPDKTLFILITSRINLIVPTIIIISSYISNCKSI